MKCTFKILAVLGVLAGGILLVDYKTNILMAVKNTSVVDKVSEKVQCIFNK